MRIIALLCLVGTLIAAPAHSQWVRVDSNLPTTALYNVSLFEVTAEGVYGAALEGPPYEVRMYASLDNGDSWSYQAALGAFEGADVPTVFSNEDGLLAGAWLLQDGTATRFVFSDDGGSTWRLVIAPGVPEPLSFGRSESNYYVGATGALARSTDSGNTWTVLHQGQLAGVSAILADGDEVFIATGAGNFYSSDQGATLTPITVSPAVFALNGAWKSGGRFYLKSFLGSVFASDDQGQTWSEQSTFSPFEWGTAEPTLDGGTWVLWNTTGRFWLSSDQGASGTEFSDGWPLGFDGNACSATHVRASNTFVYAVAFCGFGAGDIRWYRRELETIGTSLEAPPERSASLTVFPNPATDVFNVQLDGTGDRGRMEVFDLLGRRMHAEDLLSGRDIQVSARGWAPGLYLVRAIRGSQVLTEQVLISP